MWLVAVTVDRAVFEASFRICILLGGLHHKQLSAKTLVPGVQARDKGVRHIHCIWL